MNDPIVLPKVRQMGRTRGTLEALVALAGMYPLAQLGDMIGEEQDKIDRAEEKRARKRARGPGFSRPA